MKNVLSGFMLLWLLSLPYAIKAQEFSFATKGNPVMILYSKGGPKLDSIAAHLLAQDIQRITGTLPQVVTNVNSAKGNVVVIGNAQSNLVQSFSGKQSTLQKNLQGKWECFAWKIIDRPDNNISQALVIAGSDARGTAYGVFTLSEKIGVSPWYWWADVNPVKNTNLTINISDFVSNEPSVQYRGIFLNDEDWGLQPWAAKTFEPATKDIGPKTYAKIFELLLRLKANLIWPAMHPSTKAFYYYPQNKNVASDYEIVVGSSHAEPMLRNNVDEWDKKKGSFNYITNKENVLGYWASRLKESKVNNAIYTMGMRGIHDGKMEGIKTTQEAVPLLEGIFEDQRNLLSKYISPDVKSIPQALTVYKEVLEIYEHGLKVPEDITLVWPDDNYGYIHRLANDNEKTRKGGTGIYYHASYWGRPHDYLWLSTTHPALVREEMTKAYEMDARKIWVLNVGDIKPLEYNTQQFLDMAYDVTPFLSPDYTKKHLYNWAANIFGKENAEGISKVLWQYYQLAFERRPEFMGWNSAEPITSVNFTQYNHYSYGDEAEKRINRYNQLEIAASVLQRNISPVSKDAFYQLVLYPVRGASLMNKKYLYRDKAYLYAMQGRLSAYDYYKLAQDSYNEISSETRYFNEKLVNGKWDGIMSMKPRELPVFDPPKLELSVQTSARGFSIRPEGLSDSVQISAAVMQKFQLPNFNRYSSNKYFVDVFLTKETAVEYQIIPSHKWIKISRRRGKLTAGKLNSEHRFWVEVDWTKVPLGDDLNGAITVKGSGAEYPIAISVKNQRIPELANFKGFVESNGYVSINAASYNRTGNNNGKSWEKTEGMGTDANMLEARPLTAAVDSTESGILKNPYIEYDFYNFNSSPAKVHVYTLPTFPINNNYEMRYAVKIDNGPLSIINFKTVGRTDEWKSNVLRNNAIKSVNVSELKAGMHRMRIYMVDPGVILDKIFINLSGKTLPYGDVSETLSTSGN